MKYIVRYKFFTAKAGRKGHLKGNWGNAETEITTDASVDDLLGDLLPEVKRVCHNSIKDMAKVVKQGRIINVDVKSITPK